MHSLCPSLSRREHSVCCTAKCLHTHLGREGKKRGRGAGEAASCSLRKQMEMQY